MLSHFVCHGSAAAALRARLGSYRGSLRRGALRVQKLEGSLDASRSEMARLAAESSFVKAKADEYATELKKWMKACCPR